MAERDGVGAAEDTCVEKAVRTWDKVSVGLSRGEVVCKQPLLLGLLIRQARRAAKEAVPKESSQLRAQAPPLHWFSGLLSPVMREQNEFWCRATWYRNGSYPHGTEPDGARGLPSQNRRRAGSSEPETQTFVLQRDKPVN